MPVVETGVTVANPQMQTSTFTFVPSNAAIPVFTLHWTGSNAPRRAAIDLRQTIADTIDNMRTVMADAMADVPVYSAPETLATQAREAPAPEPTSPDERARALLVSLLDDEQREEFERRGFFHVTSDTNRVYRITHGWTGNVELLHNPADKHLPSPTFTGICCHPASTIPIHDNMAGQLLRIRHDEMGFLKLANQYGGRGWPADIQAFRRSDAPLPVLTPGEPMPEESPQQATVTHSYGSTDTITLNYTVVSA